MLLNIYLFFDGECAQAFEFYRSIFGGEYMAISTYREGPEEMGVAEEHKDKLMHVSLPVGDNVLMGSDSIPSFGPSPTAGDNFNISFAPDSREQADTVFEQLLEGGEVKMPLQETFWGSYFGQGRDKFGIGWMINLNL